jgi:GNAT superfamily N-acetyltransferase
MTENNDIVIRSATESDMPSLSVLMNELGYATTEADMRGRYELLKAHADYSTWVAEYNRHVAGMIGLIKNIYYEKNGIYIRVGALVVSSEYRNKGIGKALMQKASAWAIENGATQIVLNSGNREERKTAHAFYQHLGFEPKTTGFVKIIK